MRKNLPLIVAALAFGAILLFVFTFDFGAFTRAAPPYDPGKTRGDAQAPVTFVELSDFQ